jgi:arylsulfatase
MIVIALASTQVQAQNRASLPIPAPERPTYSELDVRTTKAPKGYAGVSAPKGAPNIVVILVDDIGYGAASPFGGPIRMPNMEQLASQGVRFNHFHTTALCSPTRVALQSGRNHHAANMGNIMEWATAYPGYTGRRPEEIAFVAEMLRLNGYSTAHFGKCHEVAAWEVSPSGPFERWPTGAGYDRFYGFMGGETDQWHPTLYDQNQIVDPAAGNPGYHLTVDMTDRAIAWIRQHEAVTPDRPYFVYFATGAVHAPHHVPEEYIERNKGRFDKGWDAMREEILARQIKLGWVPEGTKNAPRPKDIQAWDDLNEDERRLFTRQAEIWSAFGEHTDEHLGRLIDAVDALPDADNTLVITIIGDNGSSAEGGMVGLYNELTYFNGIAPTVADNLSHFDQLGGAKSYPHMAAGWAHATAAPFSWMKQVASDFGGTRNPMMMRWPARFKADSTIRTQFHHVTDVAPTILEAAGLPEPKVVNGVKQRPMDGVSMLYAIDDPSAETRHPTQYFEIMGNRAIYHEGWFARVLHFLPWQGKPDQPLSEDTWELYDTTKDFSLRNNVAAQHPERLKALQALFQKVGEQNHVFPIDDRRVERTNPEIAGRPDIMAKVNEMTVYEGMAFQESAFVNLKNHSFKIEADVKVGKEKPAGVILSQGGFFGGWSAWLDQGVPVYSYNYLGIDTYTVRGNKPLAEGKNEIVFDFAYDEGEGVGKGGTMTISVNGESIGNGRIEKTQPFVMSTETTGVGFDTETPVVPEYGAAPKNEFRGGTLGTIKVSRPK